MACAGALAGLIPLLGCQQVHQQARADSVDRWNHVRAEIKLQLASDQLAAGHVDDAATTLAAASELDPSSPQLCLLQARVLLSRGDTHAAADMLTRIHATGKIRGEAEYLLGVIDQQRLHDDVALTHFARAADEDPYEIAYISAIAEVMLRQDQAAEALEFLDSYEDEFEWTAAYQVLRAECLEQLGDWTAAARAWRDAMNSSTETDMRERLAWALYGAKQWEEAAELLSELIREIETQTEQNPVIEPESSPSLRLALAECLLETGRPDAARDQVSNVMQAHPPTPEALQLLARSWAAQGNFERAHQIAERSLRLEPEDPLVIEFAAAMAWQAGDRERALTLAHHVLSGFPDADVPVAATLLALATE